MHDNSQSLSCQSPYRRSGKQLPNVYHESKPRGWVHVQAAHENSGVKREQQHHGVQKGKVEEN